jgi:NTE family protein
MYGLVFAGGGAKGAYQIGVWRALTELDIKVGLSVGTSVGALNGALYAQKEYELAKDLWLNMSMKSVFSGEQEFLDGLEKTFNKQVFKNDMNFYRKFYRYVSENRGLDITPLRNNIQNILNEEKIRNSGIDFGFVTYSINERKPLKLFIDKIQEGEIKYYLLGSALVPGFAQDKNFPIKFIDGGIHDRFPIQMAIDKGYKDIIAVETRKKKPKKYLNANVTYIVPSGDTGNFLIFDKNTSKRNMTMGYLDGLRTFEKVFGHSYFFKDTFTNKQFLKSLMKMSNSKLGALFVKTIKPEEMTLKQFLEVDLPYIIKKLSLKNTYSYQDTIFSLLEYLLKYNEIERLELYSIEEALRLIDNDFLEESIESKVRDILKSIVVL